jgi:hypothetical protein
MLSFTNEELLALLQNRARYEDRIAARAADRLATALDLLRRTRTYPDAQERDEIDAFLRLSN